MMIPVASVAQEAKVIELNWQMAATLPASPGQAAPLGFAGPVTGASNNVLIVAGGANFPAGMPWEGGKKKYYDDVYAYAMKNNRLVLQPSNSKLPEPFAYAAVCTTPAGIFFGGGENENGISGKTGLLKWDDAAQKLEMEQLPHLPVAVTNAAAVVSAGVIYVAGGETPDGVSDKFYCIDIHHISNGWKMLAPLPVQVSHMVLIAAANQQPVIYLAGGRKKNAAETSTLYKELFAYDMEKNEWSRKASMPYSLMAGTGIASGSNNLLLFGGDTGETFHETEILINKISLAGNDAEKQALIKQKNHLQSTHPGFSKTILYYNIKEDKWIPGADMPYPAQVTTSAIYWQKHIIIPSGEIRAGVRTPLIVSATINTGK